MIIKHGSVIVVIHICNTHLNFFLSINPEQNCIFSKMSKLYYYEFSVIFSARAEVSVCGCALNLNSSPWKALLVSAVSVFSHVRKTQTQACSNLNICQLNLNKNFFTNQNHLSSFSHIGESIAKSFSKMANSNQDFPADSQVPGSEMPWTGM